MSFEAGVDFGRKKFLEPEPPRNPPCELLNVIIKFKICPYFKSVTANYRKEKLSKANSDCSRPGIRGHWRHCHGCHAC